MPLSRLALSFCPLINAPLLTFLCLPIGTLSAPPQLTFCCSCFAPLESPRHFQSFSGLEETSQWAGRIFDPTERVKDGLDRSTSRVMERVEQLESRLDKEIVELGAKVDLKFDLLLQAVAAHSIRKEGSGQPGDMKSKAPSKAGMHW